MWAPFWGVNGGFRRGGWWQLTTRSGPTAMVVISAAGEPLLRSSNKLRFVGA